MSKTEQSSVNKLFQNIVNLYEQHNYSSALKLIEEHRDSMSDSLNMKHQLQLNKLHASSAYHEIIRLHEENPDSTELKNMLSNYQQMLEIHLNAKEWNHLLSIFSDIDGKNVSFRTELHSGDSVEILTSTTQKPNRDWLNICKSSRAKAKIRLALKETQVKDGLYAKELLERRFKNKKIEIEDSTMGQLIRKLGFKEVSEFYKQIADEKLDPNYVIEEYQKVYNHAHNLNQTKETESAENFEFENPTTEYLKKNDDVLVIDKNLKGLDFSLAKCCHPIYGDPVFGFVTVSGGIKIHRDDCPNAPEMRKRFGYRVVKARWSGKGTSQYAITLRVIGNDDIGIVSNISNIISKDEKIVMRSINIDSNDGLFSGNLVVLLDDNSKLNMLIKKLRTVKGVKEVMRI